LQGLGKTLQTIALLAALFDKRGLHNDAAGTLPDGRRRPRPPRTPHTALLVVPKSVLLNWERELDTWATFARVTAYAKKDQDAALDAVRAGTAEVCLTTYGIYQRRLAEFKAQPWSVVVFDEAHMLQNSHTKAHAAADEAPPSAFRLFLTGTVMSNNFKELHTMLSLVDPGCLGNSRQFAEEYARPIGLGRRVNATQADQALYGQRCRALQRVVRTHMLARQKKDAAIKPQLKGLLRKTDNIVFCELSPLQQAAYDRMQRSEDFELLWRYSDPCDCGSGDNRGKCCHRECNGALFGAVDHTECPFVNAHGEDDQKCPRCCILPFLLLSQKLGNHLELVKADADQSDAEKVKRDTLVAQAVLGEDAAAVGGLFVTDQWSALADERHCGKLRALKALLLLWRRNPNDKVLLFSYSTRLLTILEHFLLQEGHTFSRLDGKTPTKQRKQLVDNFNAPSSSTFIILISTRAGGVGLNLTGANRVVIFDPNWNPAHDLQAQDRAYRLGQGRDVTVYRLIAAHTIEEQVYLRQVAKQHNAGVGVHGVEERRLFTGVLGSRGQQGELLGLRNLFAPRAGVLNVQKVVDREAQVAAAYRAAAWDADAFTDEEEDDDEEEARRAGGAGGSGAGAASEAQGDGDDEDDDGSGAMARRLVRAASRREAAGADEHEEEEEDEEEEDDDEQQNAADAALAGAGVLHLHQHAGMLGPGAVEARIAAEARAAAGVDDDHEDVAVHQRPLRMRAPIVPPQRVHIVNGVAAVAALPARAAAGRAAAAPDARMGALALLARERGVSVPELAQQLCAADRLERDNMVDLLLRKHNIMRGD
jgi:superfamily II DNA or RNA helicase